MCLGIPGRIVEFTDPTGQLARVDVSGVKRLINVGLVSPDGLGEGDWVLIHVGFALSKIDEREARRTTEFLLSMGDAFDQELTQFTDSEIE
jgi:hydrogenase expression/formation protein HypC